MTFPRVQDVSRTAVIDSPIKPTTGTVAAAVRALALAVDLEVVTETRFADGVTQTEVSTIGLPRRLADRIWVELLAGLTVVDEPKPWLVGGLLCREATGVLLGMRVRVVATGPVGQVAA